MAVTNCKLAVLVHLPADPSGPLHDHPSSRLGAGLLSFRLNFSSFPGPLPSCRLREGRPHQRGCTGAVSVSISAERR